MEFAFTQEQCAVADLAAHIFGAHGSDDYLRELAESGRTFDTALWTRLKQSGLVSVALAEHAGGSGLGMTELGLVLEQQGRHLALVPLWQHQLASIAIEAHGTASLRQRILPGLAQGEQIVAMATELGACAGVRATHTPNGWVLDGRRATVVLDHMHSWLLLDATTVYGPRLFLIAANQDGMRKTHGVLTDLQPVCDLEFDNAPLPDDCVLDVAALTWLEPRVALCIASLQLGVLAEALRRTAIYVSERHQFGRPIGSFQAIAMRAADSYIEVELLRSAQWQLGWRLDQGLPATAAGRVAKHHASQAGYIVGHSTQHLHGGVGADLRYPIHRFYLKSQALAAIGGNAEAQLARIGRELALPSYGEYIHD